MLHVVVESDPDVMTARIEADEVEKGARQWRLDHLGAYADARDWMVRCADLVVDSTHLTPEATTHRVWESVAERLGARRG